MYKFLGKKGAFYLLDLEPIRIKLNFNCPDDYKNGEGEGSCKGYKPGSKTLDNNSTKKIISSTSTKKSLKSSSSKSRIASSEETISDLTKSNDKLLLTIKNSKDQEEIKKLQRIVDGNNKSIEYFKNKIKTPDTVKVNDVAKKVRSGKKITKDEYNVLKPLVEKSSVKSKDYNKKDIISSSFMKTEEYKNMMKDSSKLLEQPDYKKAVEAYITDSSNLNIPLIKYPNVINKNNSINKIINDTEGDISRQSIETIFKMDELLENSRTKEDIIVHSGISKKLYDKLNENDNEFQASSFISTSANKKVAEGFAEYKNDNTEGFMLEIKLAKGSSAIATNDFIQKTKPFGKNATYIVGENGKFFTSGSQHEIILGRNTVYKLVEKRIDNVSSKKMNYKIPIHVLVVEAYTK